MSSTRKLRPIDFSEREHSRRSASAPALEVERRLLGAMLRSLGLSDVRVNLWDGSVAHAAPEGSPTVHIRDRRALYQILLNPSIGFGDGYATGRVELDGDLLEVLERVYMAGNIARGTWLTRLTGFLRRPRSNSLSESRFNIHNHYDLGNDFYRLWLDREMVYTCAYYPTEAATLEEAQLAKMEHVCRKLQLAPGQRVLELGCGWGALALHMAERYGVRVQAYNISREQIAFARERAKERGLDGRVDFLEDDYRNATGSYDRVVSVGMLEHVGIANYPTLGGVIDRCLTAEGLGLIHTIGRNTPRRMDPWIEKRIFPGACPPTLRQMMDIFVPVDLTVLDVENLRLHYARTCADWLGRFEAQCDRVRPMFDDYFVRAWRLYLAGSVTAFITGSLQLFQVLFNRRSSNRVPMTRDYLYADRD